MFTGHFVTYVFPVCLSGYDELGDVCIHVSTDTFSWAEAENYCVNTMGGGLAVLSDHLLYIDVADYLNAGGQKQIQNR